MSRLFCDVDGEYQNEGINGLKSETEIRRGWGLLVRQYQFRLQPNYVFSVQLPSWLQN